MNLNLNFIKSNGIAVAILCAALFTISCDKDKEPVVLVTKITLDKAVLTLGVGDKETLIASVLPEDATNSTVNWLSSDPAVATVDKGAVTAVANGKTTITAVTQDGSLKGTCTVAVSPLGRISFRTDKTWEVGSQIWSDVVMASGAKKDDFYGGTYENPDLKVDFRQNEGYGDWFSWEAVRQYKDLFAFDGWRVPTKKDFYELDLALGGDGGNDRTDYELYLTQWGGELGGYCEFFESVLQLQYVGEYVIYWTHEEGNETQGYSLNFGTARNRKFRTPQAMSQKYYGAALRLVKDKK